MIFGEVIFYGKQGTENCCFKWLYMYVLRPHKIQLCVLAVEVKFVLF
jgi:hypothetical protein